MIIIDTSGLLAALNASDRRHAAAVTALRAAPGPRLLSPFVLAELDYLLATRVGLEAELSLLDEVGRGAYRLENFEALDVARAQKVIASYSDHGIGLADASLVVLSERYGSTDVLTLDERHFRVLRGAGGSPFRLLPADA